MERNAATDAKRALLTLGLVLAACFLALGALFLMRPLYAHGLGPEETAKRFAMRRVMVGICGAMGCATVVVTYAAGRARERRERYSG